MVVVVVVAVVSLVMGDELVMTLTHVVTATDRSVVSNLSDLLWYGCLV